MYEDDTQFFTKHLVNTWTELTQYLWKNPDALLKSINSSENTFTQYQDLLNFEKNNVEYDKRFQHIEWQKNLALNFIKRSYLLVSKQLTNFTENLIFDDIQLKKKLHFFVRQYLDSLSPTNFATLNPAVIEKMVTTSGNNLIEGFKKLNDDLNKGKSLLTLSLTDEGAFCIGKNIACTPGKVIYQNKIMQLISYTPLTDKVFQIPILIIPPWINKYYILDLSPENSLVKWLLEHHFNVFIISWVNPNQAHKYIQFDNYLQQGALKALKIVHQLTQQKVHTVGYCAGGTLLSCLLAYLSKQKLSLVKTASFFTTLFDFSEPGELGVFIDHKQIDSLEKEMHDKGYLDGKILASIFSLLRADDLVWATFVNNYLKGEKPKPFDLLYWNSDSVNIPAKVHSFYLRNMYLENKLIQKNKIKLAGIAIDLKTIKNPCYFLAALDDHIIPWQSSYQSFLHLKCKKKFVLTTSGHVAGVINPPQKHKYGYWTNNRITQSPQEFANKGRYHSGSWWLNWERWLRIQSGNKSNNNLLYIKSYIEFAPGNYVKVRSDEKY